MNISASLQDYNLYVKAAFTLAHQKSGISRTQLVLPPELEMNHKDLGMALSIDIHSSAIEILERILEFGSQNLISEHLLLADVMCELAHLKCGQDSTKARDLLKQALQIYQQDGDIFGEAHGCYLTAKVLFKCKEHNAALEMLTAHKCLEKLDQCGATPSKCNALLLISEINGDLTRLYAMEKPPKLDCARACALEALTKTKLAADLFQQLNRHFGFGSAMLQQGELNLRYASHFPDLFSTLRARTCFETAFHIFGSTDMVITPAGIRMQIKACERLEAMTIASAERDKWTSQLKNLRQTTQ
jgi:tetratricopeptide (TPR) repeat protein